MKVYQKNIFMKKEKGEFFPSIISLRNGYGADNNIDTMED